MCTVTAPANKKQKTEGTYICKMIVWLDAILCLFQTRSIKVVPMNDGTIENQVDF